MISSSSSSNPTMRSRIRGPNFIPNSGSNPNPNPNPKFSKPSNRPKRSGRSSRDLSKSLPKSNHSDLVMGQVKILKRGEPLTDYSTSCRSGRRDVVQKKDENTRFDEGAGGLVTEDLVSAAAAKQIGIADFYASSGFFSSPSPSCLPVPAFFKNKTRGGVLTENNDNDNDNDNDDNATSGLMRLLNLNH